MEKPKAKLIIVKDPLNPKGSSYEIQEFDPFKSLLEYRSEFLPTDVEFAISVNGVVVADEKLPSTFIRENDCVVFKPRLGDKTILRAIAMIAVVVFAYWAAPFIAGFIGLAGSAIATAAIAAGIVLVGGLVVNSLLPPPGIGGMEGEPSVYSWGGPANTQRQGIPIPIVYGEIRTGGNIIASYTYNDGEKQYISVLCCVSLGPIDSISGIELKSNHIQTMRMPQ